MVNKKSPNCELKYCPFLFNIFISTLVEQYRKWVYYTTRLLEMGLFYHRNYTIIFFQYFVVLAN